MTDSSGALLLGVAAVVIALGAALFAVSRAWGGRGDFEIRLGPGDRVEVRGRVPKAKVFAIRDFFREQPGGVPLGKVTGTFGPGGTPSLRFSGPIDPALCQRARNFLIEHLR